MCTKENVNNATTVNNYNRVYVSKYTDCDLYDKYSAGSVDDIAFNMSSILNDFIEIDKAVKLIITFNVDYEGKDANGYDSMAYISISKNKTNNSFIVWISNTFRMECANYLPKVKEGLNNSGYNYTFKDENKIMSKKAKDSKKMNDAKNRDDYNFITITRFNEHGALLIQDNVHNGMSKIAKVITSSANTFTDTTSEVNTIVVALETNSDGIGFNDYTKALSVMIYKKDGDIVVRISDYLNNYPGYMNAIKKGLKDADKSIHFVDSKKNMVKIFDEVEVNEPSATTDCCVTADCERDNDDFNDNNPFYDLLSEIDCYSDDNFNVNHIQHEIISDIKDLITGAKQVWNLKYDANIINDIRDLINECYKKVQKD